LKIKVSRFRKDALLPTRKTEGSAGWDLRACLDNECIVHPGETKIINTGLNVSIPLGWEIQIRSRSGLATKGIHVLNSPGTIDSDYKGVGEKFEINVIIHNSGSSEFRISNQDRIAQAVVSKIPDVEWIEVDSIEEETNRKGGLGSTGIK